MGEGRPPPPSFPPLNSPLFFNPRPMSYLLDNSLLSNRQYGFIKGRSTVLQLLQMMDKWTEFSEYGGQIDVMYSDFQKAFDRVPHKRLLSKLH